MPDRVKAIEDSLNAHYKPAVVEWKVDVNGSDVTVPSITPEGFKTAGSGLFARYTSDMRKVINAFEQQHGAIGKDDLCLFFVDVADQSRDGFMPLDGQYGFIFNFNNDPATVAHELAHGAFNLRHTFSSKAQHNLPEKTTHNLLDYANGTELWKYQWDLIHNPEIILLGFMQDESEGAKEATPLLNVAWTKASVPDGLFLSPGGMPICLTGLTELALLKSAESGIDSRTVLKSVLYGFVKGEQRYFANFNGGRFTGYFQEGTTSENDVYTDTEGVTKKLVQSGRYDITLLGIDGEAPTTRQVDNNLWYDQPDWSNYTAQGTQITIVDDYTFIPCGSLLRQYKDSPLMESHVLKTAILNNPCILEGPMLHFADYQIESQWMKEFNQVFGLAANVAFFPAAVDVLFPIIVEKMGEEAGRRFLTGALIDLSANLIANQILGLENIGGEIIPDLVVAGLRDVFVNKSQVGQFILNCGIGINLETIGKIRNSKSGEEQFRLYRDLGIECLIPAVMGVVANKLAAKIANNPRTMSKSFQYLVDKAKLDETYIGTVLYDCLKLDVVLSSRNLVTKNLYKSILSTEFGAKAMDLLIEAQIDIATISGKNFQRLSNILAKFGTGQDDALLKIL